MIDTNGRFLSLLKRYRLRLRLRERLMELAFEILEENQFTYIVNQTDRIGNIGIHGDQFCAKDFGQ